MPSKQMLAKYAAVAVNVGVGIGPGDRLIITAPVTTLAFTRLLVREAYRAGASNVDVLWDDDDVTLSRFTDGSLAAAESVTGYSQLLKAAIHTKDFSLKVLAENPNLLSGQKPELVAAFQQVNRDHIREFDVLRRNFHTQWAVVAASVPEWAKSVFPDLESGEAVESLWDAIFRTCRIDEEDPIAAWDAHCGELQARADFLNTKTFKSIRYSGPGTDLTLGLPDNHIWRGGSTKSQSGRSFVPNIPTEEVFTAPHRNRGDGVIAGTKPVTVAGNVVSGLVVTVENGKVIEATASQGQEILDRTLASDDGALHFGEVALVPQSGSVAREKLVWNNVLFDENDACHIAFGQSYGINLDGGSTMREDDLRAAGMNQSSIHLDFVVGSEDLDIFGIRDAGSPELIMSAGEWAFEV